MAWRSKEVEGTCDSASGVSGKTFEWKRDRRQFCEISQKKIFWGRFKNWNFDSLRREVQTGRQSTKRSLQLIRSGYPKSGSKPSRPGYRYEKRLIDLSVERFIDLSSRSQIDWFIGTSSSWEIDRCIVEIIQKQSSGRTVHPVAQGIWTKTLITGFQKWDDKDSTRGHCKWFAPKDPDSELEPIVFNGVYLRGKGISRFRC
jgi:hypothetical protein